VGGKYCGICGSIPFESECNIASVGLSCIATAVSAQVDEYKCLFFMVSFTIPYFAESSGAWWYAVTPLGYARH
jgi:hypothetical protein